MFKNSKGSAMHAVESKELKRVGVLGFCRFEWEGDT